MRPDLRWHPRAIAAMVRSRLRALFAGREMDRELDEELRFHLDMEREKNLRAGMPAPEAARVARVTLGGIDRAVEAHRDARGVRVLEDFVADLRYAARALARTPGFIVVSILTLATTVAIGTLAFTAVNAFFYRPLPVPDGEELLAVFTSDWNGPTQLGASSYADVLDLAREVRPIADMAGEARTMMTLAATDEVAYVQGAIVSDGYFRVMRVRPALGRFPVAADAPAIVVSHSLWRRAFGGDSAIVGRRIAVNGQPFVLAAVAPPDFRGVNRENGVDFWMDGRLTPMVLLRDDLLRRRTYRSFRVAARLRDGASLDALNAGLRVAAHRLSSEYPDAWRDTTGGGRVVTAMREQEANLANVPRTERLLLLTGVIGFGLALVIVACTNLASLQMARGAGRRREIATRLALGAGRARVVRQLLAECGLVAAPGIVAGVLLAVVAARLLSLYRPIPLPSWDLALDWRALAFISGGLLLTMLVFGLVPALQTVRADVAYDLKGGDQPGRGGLRVGGLRGALIVAQVALSMVFTASAGLVAIALGRHLADSRGDATTLLVSRVNFLPAAGDSARVEALLRELLDAVRGIPGVNGASAAAFIPIRGSRMTVYGETRAVSGALEKRELDGNYIRPGYFDVAGMTLLRGRDFDTGDFSGRRSVIVSKAMADALWPGEDALGKPIRIGDERAFAEVVGIVRDPTGFVPATDRSYPGMIYLPLRPRREAEMILHFRVPSGQGPVAERVAELMRGFGPTIVAPKAVTLDAYYDRMLTPMRLISQGAAILAGLQLLLAIAGLVGLVAYVTELRRREIGIRTALGATRASVLRLIMRQGVRLTAIGGVIGLFASGMVASVVAGALPLTAPLAGVVLTTAAVLFAMIGTVAMLMPARRALRIAPAEALRVD